MKSPDSRNLLVLIHVPSNTGYAVGRLEPIFFEMAIRLTGSPDKVHFAYPSLKGGHPSWDTRGRLRHVVELSLAKASGDPAALLDYVQRKKIKVIFGFDLPVTHRLYRRLRRAGVQLLAAYWGAPLSGPTHGLRLLLKKLEMRLKLSRPELFIFESEAMVDSAIIGRGLPASATSLVRLGVEINEFAPREVGRHYASDLFGFPRDRLVVYYSGHMEPRKGVDVIIRAALNLIEKQGREDLHFLFLGNRQGQEVRFKALYKNRSAEQYITFGGYRDDIAEILPSCDIGVIASVGWDSFTMSALEMAATGLPLVVSRLQGLTETVVEGETGLLFPPGDFVALAQCIARLADDRETRERYGNAARERIGREFSVERQVQELVKQVASRWPSARNEGPLCVPGDHATLKKRSIGR